MKTLTGLTAALLLALSLVACGEDSGTGSKTVTEKVPVQADLIDDLPDCSKNRDGEIAEVLGERKAYLCENGRWEFDHDILDSVKTEDDQLSSDSKNESDKKGGDVSSSSMADTPNGSNEKVEVETTGTVKDARDGKTYKTIRIGNQVWFAENLNYDDGYGLCPMHKDENCAKYGRLYNFESNDESSIVSVCPEGWHVPDALEFDELISYVSEHNGGEHVGVSLKATKGWYAEGETVVVPGGGDELVRVAATPGTDRFGFAALPAGSCWTNGGCYVGDDTRFFFMSSGHYGGGYKLAFDSDEFLYDEDAVYGNVSVRCLRNRNIKIDAMPPVITIDSLMWMAQDLTSGGNSEFRLHEAFYVCPEGWRLPTADEFFSVGSKMKETYPEERTEYFIPDAGFQYGISWSCGSLGCGWSSGAQKAQRHVRCVSANKLKTISDCSCSASKLDANSTITWTVSGCNEGDYKISGYTWDFGDDSDGVTSSGAKASKKFTKLGSVTPSVIINGSANVDGKSYSAEQILTCPSAKGGPSETTVVFSSNEKVKLYAGRKYTAMLDGKCNENNQKASVSCTFDAGGDESNIQISVYEFTGPSPLGGSVKTVCNGINFTVKTSADMECYLSY